MKRMRIVGLALVAAFALGAIGVSSASAFPEIGRCVAKTGGKYLTSNCVSKGKGSFEWVKGAAKLHWSGAGGESVLEGASGIKISCKGNTSEGTYKLTSGAIKEVEKVKATFTGCEVPLFSAECHGIRPLGAPGEIITTELKGPLKDGPNAKEVVQELKPQIAKKGFAEFECPAIGAIVYVGEGAEKGKETILSVATPVDAEPALTSTSTYTAGPGGNQVPDHIKGSAVIDNLESSTAGPKGKFEKSSQSQTETLTNEEPLELKYEA